MGLTGDMQGRNGVFLRLQQGIVQLDGLGRLFDQHLDPLSRDMGRDLLRHDQDAGVTCADNEDVRLCIQGIGDIGGNKAMLFMSRPERIHAVMIDDDIRGVGVPAHNYLSVFVGIDLHNTWPVCPGKDTPVRFMPVYHELIFLQQYHRYLGLFKRRLMAIFTAQSPTEIFMLAFEDKSLIASLVKVSLHSTMMTNQIQKVLNCPAKLQRN
jgi:hypothetical protein